MHRTSSKGGLIAVIITIVLTGGLVYLGIANGSGSAPAASSESSAGMEGHHTTASGPTSNLDSLVGKPAPDFTLADHNGQTHSLASLRGKNVVLFFNEGVMCYPACWNQVAAFGSDSRFSQRGVEVLSIVVDSAREWQDAVRQMPELGATTVLHDPNGKISSTYGMLTTKSSMHYGRYPGHSYVIVDRDGIIRHVLDDPTMSIHDDLLISELDRLSS